MVRKLLLVLLVLANTAAFSQFDDHRMAPGERLLIPSYMQSRSGQNPSVQTVTPPVSAVRTMAEWEELQGLIVAWTSYTTMIREIIRAAREETTVYVLCTNPTTVYGSLLSNNVDTSNVVCLTTPFNSIWSRDYGPWSAYTNEVDTLITIDWIYNRPRPSDDQVPVSIANLLNTPLYQTTTAPWDLVHTGGNFMTDGAGTGFSSLLVNTENGPGGSFGLTHTPAEVDTIMNRFMGINRYVKMTPLPFDVIHHIDMHMKLLDEETILMGEYPAGVADGPQIEANLQYVLSNYMSCYGTPYKVVRIPMPSDGGFWPNNGGDYFTYTNSSFINKTIIVPTYNIPSDTLALSIYRNALPGYKVVGINSLASIGALGALHCITKEVGTSDPLLIRHQPLGNTSDTLNGYTVTAYFNHRSGLQDTQLNWTTDTTQAYIGVPMTGIGNNQYSALIPPQPAGTTVFYYLEGISVSGKQQVRPLPAPAGYWKFDVTGVTAIQPIEVENQLKDPYPNPSKGMTCIPLQLSVGGQVEAWLSDVTGRQIMAIYAGYKAAGEQNLFLDSSSLPAGIYQVHVRTIRGTSVKSLAVR